MTLRYHTFQNTDPPVLANIWRSRSGQRGFLQPVSADLFEQYVMAKPYFDYKGLFVARQDDRPAGFAHAAFGSNESGDKLSYELGVTCVVVVRPDCAEAETASGLLERCEQYLRSRGARVLYGGAIRPLNPFYLGLYGGSELPGVLDSDLVARELYRSHNYKEVDRTIILHGDLRTFLAPIDRRQQQIRRKMLVQVTADPPTRNWWEACTIGDFDLTRFELVPRGGGPPLAHATVRNMEATSMSGPARMAGLIELGAERSHRRRGLATFLLTEVFRQLIRQGFTFIEAQTMQHNVAGVGLYRKLGFREVDQGIVFRKEAGR